MFERTRVCVYACVHALHGPWNSSFVLGVVVAVMASCLGYVRCSPLCFIDCRLANLANKMGRFSKEAPKLSREGQPPFPEGIPIAGIEPTTARLFSKLCALPIELGLIWKRVFNLVHT